MRLTYFANACCLMEAQGFRILTDPWLTDGAFEGSWCHYPPLKVRPRDLADVDALYISHIHPDHCDPTTLSAFPREIPILVLDHPPNFLHRVLRGMGFSNLIAVRDGAQALLGPFEVTLYAPFTTHVFHDSALGNLIDSSALFAHGGFSVMNFNDNTPDLAAARRLRARHGPPTVAQIAYNAAGPYPSCFDNLAPSQKETMAERVLERNFDHAAALARILEPAWHMPFAGAFVLGGAQWRKNFCLGTTSADVAAAGLRKRNPDIPVLLLNEGQTVDLASGQREGAYQPADRLAELRHIETVLAARPYPHEADQAPDPEHLIGLCESARQQLWSKQQAYDCRPKLGVAIAVGEGWYRFDLSSPEGAYCAAPPPEPRIAIRMDPRLLNRILMGTAHWNNAEGGCHIDFVREPDVYVRDFHTLMSFFAADVAVRAQVTQAVSHKVAS